MLCREYDDKRDSSYEPNVTIGLYLSPERFEKALTSMSSSGEECENDMRDILRKIEEINRDEKLGKISSQLCVELNRDIEDKFRAKYGIWPYQTLTYKMFYQQFGDRDD